MRRPSILVILTLLCLAVPFAAMAWISARVLRLDAETQRHIHNEENIRLALWRMDSALAPLIAQETARPYFAYTAFAPAERAYTRMFNDIEFGEVLFPSPLLTFESPLVRLHFQLNPDWTVSSPQVPMGNMRDLARQEYTTRERIAAAEELLIALANDLDPPALLALVPADAPATAPCPVVAPGTASALEALADKSPAPQAPALRPPAPPQQSIAPRAAQRRQESEQAARSQLEYGARVEVNVGQAQNLELLGANRIISRLAGPSPHVREGVMRPLWYGGRLLLLRHVSVNGEQYIQGCWLNWEAIRSHLLESVADLLPGADLRPLAATEAEIQPRRLATLPVVLIPGAIPFQPVRSPLMLIIAWACFLGGLTAIGLLLWGAMRLSERRAAFVSAVTHELRTPLTTVSMYAEMLEEGMVPEQRRGQYLATLRTEAARLGHLVENVLAYSRLEKGRATDRCRTLPLGQLIEASQRRLADRARQAGLELDLDISAAADTPVIADPAAVEQILFNLVDNAAKYASAATDHRLHLRASRNGRVVEIRISDHGPGIDATSRRKLFQAFSKSAQAAANSAPGVGLGLALSRRLARRMHGELSLEPSEGAGASFLFTLPIAVPPPPHA